MSASLNPRSLVNRARLLTGLIALGAASYLGLRFDFVTLPPDGCSPVSRYSPGSRLLVDRWADGFREGDCVFVTEASGVVHLALAAINNACWDLWCKVRGQPLWELLLSLAPAELVATLDLSYLEEELTEEAAVEMLTTHHASRDGRSSVLRDGYAGYDTSCGWIGFLRRRRLRWDEAHAAGRRRGNSLRLLRRVVQPGQVKVASLATQLPPCFLQLGPQIRRHQVIPPALV